MSLPLILPTGSQDFSLQGRSEAGILMYSARGEGYFQLSMWRSGPPFKEIGLNECDQAHKNLLH